MVLDHVAGDADAVEIAGPAADADVLGHGDLHVVDVVVVPHRLEQLIGEPQRHHVLDGFLAQIVVDPEHRPRREDRRDDLVELASTGQVVTERLLDHHPAPPAGLLLGQSVRTQLIDDRLEQPRRDGQIERVVAAGAAGLVQIGDRVGQFGEGLVVADLTGNESDALRQLPPDLLAEGRPGVLLDGRVDDLGEVLVGPVAPGEADQGEARGQQAAIGQVVDRRHQLLGGQVAGHPEDHQDARSGDPREPTILRVAKRIGPVGGEHQASGFPSGSGALSPGSSDPLAASSSAVCTVWTSSAHEASNFSTPSRSSTSTTSS